MLTISACLCITSIFTLPCAQTAGESGRCSNWTSCKVWRVQVKNKDYSFVDTRFLADWAILPFFNFSWKRFWINLCTDLSSFQRCHCLLIQLGFFGLCKMGFIFPLQKGWGRDHPLSVLPFSKLTGRTGFSPCFKALQIQLKLLLEHIADKRIRTNLFLSLSLQKRA